MGALAGAAARLRARARLLHFPPFGERRFVHRLQAESFPFALVESLKEEEEREKRSQSVTFSRNSVFVVRSCFCQTETVLIELKVLDTNKIIYLR